MGQIVFNGQKPKYANKLAITTGTMANKVLEENEIWLIDSTVDSVSSTNAKSSTGTGKYDKYIKGDGQTAAKNLQLYNIDSASSEGGGTPIESSEDITVVNDAQQNINRLELANKAYNSSNYSGLGKVYVKKSIQNVPIKTKVELFKASEAVVVYNNSYNSAYNAEYRHIIEEGTYDADGKSDAQAAYTTAYNNAIADGKSTDEAVVAGNAAYVTAYKAAIKGDSEKESAVSEVNTSSAAAGTNAANNIIATTYPSITWYQKRYIDGRFTESGGEKYVNITPLSRFSMHICKLTVHRGEVYQIFAKKTDSISGTASAGRYWMITEEPAVGATQVKVLQAYKMNENELTGGEAYETAFIEIEQDGVLWINYNSYTGSAGQCKIERIADTGSTIEANSVTGLTSSNTEYVIRYSHNLEGGVLFVPDNSVLNFEGGSIRNGIIMGSNTTIVAPPSAVILPQVTIMGSWANTEYYPKWFGAVADGVTDDTDVLQNMLDIAPNTGKVTTLLLYGYTFRTTRQLYLKSNTTIKGGTIKAKFQNQMSWVLKTYNYVASGDTVYGNSNPGALLSWQEHDAGWAESVNGGTIEDLTIIGEYNQHLTGGEFDGTYTPIFGGICIMASQSVNTKNVKISGVGVGLGRGACLRTYDDGLNIHALFVGYGSYAVNGHSIRDSYINAYCRTEQDTGVNVLNRLSYITPFYTEYQRFTPALTSGYVYNQGGIDMTDSSNKRPYFCNVQLAYNYSTLIDGLTTNIAEERNLEEEQPESTEIDNMLIDIYAEVGVVATQETNVTLRHPWFEGISKCIIYSSASSVQVDAPCGGELLQNEFDVIGLSGSVITLKGTNQPGGFQCKGGTNGASHKYSLNLNSRVNILDARVSPYPVEDDRFYFLTSGSINGLPVSVIPSSGTGSLTDNTLNAASGTYYRFNYTVNTLIVNLPDMTGVSSVRPVILYVETGNNPNISFTSPDNKTVTQYSNYEIDMNSKYEINCLFNGQKWIIAAAVVD